MRILNLIPCLLLYFSSLTVLAVQCPSPEQIRQRTIPENLEWTVDESISIEELLSVKGLFAVRIFNYGEYVSCRYTTERWSVTMDGIPQNSRCIVLPDRGEWDSTNSGQLVCRETDVTQCGFRLKCSN